MGPDQPAQAGESPTLTASANERLRISTSFECTRRFAHATRTAAREQVRCHWTIHWPFRVTPQPNLSPHLVGYQRPAVFRRRRATQATPLPSLLPTTMGHLKSTPIAWTSLFTFVTWARKNQNLTFVRYLAERTGLEPAASGVTGRRYNRLNYRSRNLTLSVHCL